ncbi:MAG: acyl carrier protein [Coriobacteriales bacterium]|nr:acyl carrier protein [Coriobacteriales bacterium]
MDRAASLEKMREVVVDQLGIDADAITEEATFVEDLGADSLDLLQLMMALESEFDIQIPDEAFENVRSVGDVLDLVEKLEA